MPGSSRPCPGVRGSGFGGEAVAAAHASEGDDVAVGALGGGDPSAGLLVVGVRPGPALASDADVGGVLCVVAVGVLELGEVGREYGCFAPEFTEHRNLRQGNAGRDLPRGAAPKMDVLASVEVLHSAPT